MQLSHLYILTNASRTFLYVGAANDLAANLEEHKQVACSAFSTEIQPVHLIYFENFTTFAQAEQRAAEVKRWRESQKWKLIMSANPCLSELLWLQPETRAA